MPKTKRSPEEIDAVCENIMENALEIIIKDGLENLSMRRLGARLNIAAKTIYNYFHNKDELYLYLLIKGFTQLLKDLQAGDDPNAEPEARLKALINAYINFGFEHSSLYNLMFTWHVPKHNDYIGTPMEKTAKKELTTALKCADFFMTTMQNCIHADIAIGEEEIQLELVQAWTQMHGYVAGINNTLLDYLYEDPLAIKDIMVHRIWNNTRQALNILNNKKS
ncbi:TetR/AcrR family transcriptional regulator [bacterium]|nr:TetR/AcrR family transcriptional regulator [bacterium]